MNLNRINPKKNTPRRNIFELKKTEKKENISKIARKKGPISYSQGKGNLNGSRSPIRNQSDLEDMGMFSHRAKKKLTRTVTPKHHS